MATSTTDGEETPDEIDRIVVGEDKVIKVHRLQAAAAVDENTIDDSVFLPIAGSAGACGRKRRTNSVIDSIGAGDPICTLPGHFTPRRTRSHPIESISPDQGYPSTPDRGSGLTAERTRSRRSDALDANIQTAPGEDELPSAGTEQRHAAMPVHMASDRYNTNHRNRGRCVVFNHEVFETGFENREGSTIDAKRIERTFKRLGFQVEICDNYLHSDLIAKINELSEEDHADNDCICIFVLTHGLNNDLICAKDVAYKSDNIWKPFTADRCKSLAGKPKLFFFQACRGDKLDGGVTLRHLVAKTETDSAVASYKIPTHADFLIAHSSVQGFYSWRNPDEGTWYIQCLCDVIDQYHETTDVLRMLTITARKVATEFASSDELNPAKHNQKQVPSITSMLIRDLYFHPK